MKHHPWGGPANNRQGPGTVKGNGIAFRPVFKLFSASGKQTESGRKPTGGRRKKISAQWEIKESGMIQLTSCEPITSADKRLLHNPTDCSAIKSQNDPITQNL